MAHWLNFCDFGAQYDTALHNSRLAPSGGHRPRWLPYGARRLSDSRARRGHHQPGFWLDRPGKSPLSSPRVRGDRPRAFEEIARNCGLDAGYSNAGSPVGRTGHFSNFYRRRSLHGGRHIDWRRKGGGGTRTAAICALAGRASRYEHADQ